MATRDIVCAYKPNLAFYIARGDQGIEALRHTITNIATIAPDVPVILDAKFADIGNTNAGYVKFAFEYLGADAVTVNPYLGGEALQPFLDCKDKGSSSSAARAIRAQALFKTKCRETAQHSGSSTNTWLAKSFRTGTRTAIAVWSLEQPTPMNFAKFAILSATRLCSFRASAHKAATSRKPLMRGKIVADKG